MRTSTILPVALIAAAMLAGCESGGVSYILPLAPRDFGAHTDQYDIKYEFIPDAQRVTEDCSPYWELGRTAFKRGTDRLIVIGRTTSYAKKDGKEVIPGTLEPRKLERVWIQVPGETPLGKAMKLEDLEFTHLTSYDINNLDGKGFFNGPNLMKGYIVLLEQDANKAVIQFDIEVRPNKPFQAENWFVKGQLELPVKPDGGIATLHKSRDVEVATGQPAAIPTTTPAPASTDPATSTNTAANTAAKTDPKVEAPVVSKPVVGKWICDTPSFEYRFQFEEDGKFIFSHCRGDGVNDTDHPGMNYGTYETKKSKSTEWAVLFVERCEFGGTSALKDLYKDKPQVMMKIEWEGENLVMTGQLAVNNRPTKFVCTPATFPDMNKKLPPQGRRKE